MMPFRIVLFRIVPVRLFPVFTGVLLVSALFVGGGCGSSGSSSTMPSSTAGTTTVNIVGQMQANSFAPNPAPVAQGSLVMWHNMDNTIHRIVLNDGSFDSGNLAPGANSAAMRLASAGGDYHCAIHPTTMFGSINVATTPPPPMPGGY